MRFRFVSICAAITIIAVLGILPGRTSTALGQTSNLEIELQNVFDQIEALKAADAEIPAELYNRYFEIEAELNPNFEDEARNTVTLDDEDSTSFRCPGQPLPLPAVGDSLVIGSETYTNVGDNCACSRRSDGSTRGGRDRVYSILVTEPSRLIIKTCWSSGFDTWLCVYRNSCCNPDSLVASNDNSTLCGPSSLKSAINQCFEDSGRYYIVVDGYNATATGHFRLAIVNLGADDCGPTPEFPCPEIFTRHEEPEEGVEGVCGQANYVEEPCPAGYCGIIEPAYDVDVYSFDLFECSVVTLRVWANDTYGHHGYGKGLDSKLRVFSGYACDHPLYINDNIGTEVDGEPWLDDSQVITTCLRPGRYWAEVTGRDTTTGDYEFTISCQPCQPVSPLGDVQVQNMGNDKFCLSWPNAGVPIYYVWRLDGGNWMLVGTTYKTEFCEVLPGANGTPYYEVYTDPCGHPVAPN